MWKWKKYISQYREHIHYNSQLSDTDISLKLDTHIERKGFTDIIIINNLGINVYLWWILLLFKLQFTTEGPTGNDTRIAKQSCLKRAIENYLLFPSVYWHTILWFIVKPKPTFCNLLILNKVKEIADNRLPDMLWTWECAMHHAIGLFQLKSKSPVENLRATFHFESSATSHIDV